MGMSYLEGTCPKCGEKTREQSNTWGYGSPIRFCPRCKQEYLDRRWREVAIDGFDPKSTSPGFYLKAFLLLVVVAAISGGWLYYTTHVKNYYSTLVVTVVIISVIGAVACLGLSIWIALGFAAKTNSHYLEESKRRLRNADYVRKLQAYGYVIPSEYLVGIGNSSDEIRES